MPVLVDGDTLKVHFDTFGIEQYSLFLKVKALPEYTVEFDRESETYTVMAPARFAHLLGVQAPQIDRGEIPLLPSLMDDQAFEVKTALAAKRFAVWSDCGLGKTLVQLEWSRQVIHRTGGKVLGITMNEIVPQTIEEAAKFYGEALPIIRLETRRQMREWAKSPAVEGEPRLAITNYEKMNPDEDGEIVNELRYLAGIVLDESHRLRTGGGKQKWALIKSTRGIPYKLSCTATPAPNDIMEFASQASFLEKMRSEGEIIWTYFVRDPRTQEWTVKKHAREAFFKFMASWSIYVRDPRRYGWRLNMEPIPEPEIIVHDIPITPEQSDYLAKITADKGGQLGLFQTRDGSAVERGKLSQVAKGFRYIHGSDESKTRKVRRFASQKPGYIADLVLQEVEDGRRVLVWTVFDAESDILAEELQKRNAWGSFDLLTGKIKESDRLNILERFRTGHSRVLISRASMLGHGMNFQFCTSMVFSGWNDSFVAYYQAVRRAYRYGQDQRVRVHIPVIRELEGSMLDNIFHKEAEHLAAIEEMESNYIAANRSLWEVAA